MYEALAWFKEHFIKCSERAALVKTWLPVQYDGPKIYLDQLVYDRALLLVCTLIRVLGCGRSYTMFRVVPQPGRSFSIKQQPQTNARSCTKNRSGVCIHCKTTSRAKIPSWKKTEPLSLLVRPISVCHAWYSRLTTSSGITRTKLRLVRCRARMGMSDKERLRDAMADQNLVDARYPPPWDLKAVQQVQQQQLDQQAAVSRS
jgi:serine/threonine-protein kinase ULK/ATG1